MAKQSKKQYYDLNVPLSPASSYPTASSTSSSATPPSRKRKLQAQMYQKRLHQLGYHGIAFSHTAFGRLDVERDDADVTLPWKDLLSSENAFESSTTNNGNASNDSFGRSNSLGMEIYRRLNIVVEEVSDVSRILLPSSSDHSSSHPSQTPKSSSKSSSKSSQTSRSSQVSTISSLLQKYDIVSIQPMNEPALQNICELLTPSTDDINPTNPQIDIVALEYATGSRGGYGLPFRLRKDYVMKVLELGVTFELCYGTAVLDPKRRQGFLRTLVDFQSTFQSIQKKNSLLNKNIPLCSNGNTTHAKSDKFPLLLSSGPRQNFSQGTDEGVMALRSPNDVQCLVSHLVGGSDLVECSNVDIDLDTFDKDSIEGGKKGTGKKKQMVTVVSAAEKVLARARNREFLVARQCFGVDAIRSCGGKQRKRKLRLLSPGDMRVRVATSMVVNGETTSLRELRRKDEVSEDEEDDNLNAYQSSNNFSLVKWLAEPLHKKKDVPEEKSEVVKEFYEVDASTSGKQHEIKSTPKEGSVAMNRELKGDAEEDDDQDEGFIAL